MPDKFGGGAVETTITPVSLALLLLSCVLLLFLPRKWLITVVLLSFFCIPAGNVFVVAGVHLFPTRVLSLVGCIRLLSMKFFSNVTIFGSRWTSFDTLFMVWAIWRSLAVVLLWQTKPAVILECGHLWGMVLPYLLIRGVIVNEEDVFTAIKVLSVIAILNCAGMVYEQLFHQNPFGVFLGGLETTPAVREGKIRSQGLFRHAILAGSFGATMFPLVLALWKKAKSKPFVIAALTACLISTAASASSTPIGALGAVMVALMFWPVRSMMKAVRWGVLVSLIGLDMVMKAPVWFIIARVSFVSGSTADFRAHLIDEFIRHFSDWWFLGILDSNSWGESMWDYSNQFVAEGLTAGLLGFILFIWILKRLYSRLGNARKSIVGKRDKEWTLWLIGCAIFGHMNAWLGVSYWDNSLYSLFTLIAIVCTITEMYQKQTPAKSVGFKPAPQFVPVGRAVVRPV